MVGSCIEKLYKIITNCKLYRHYQVEGAVSVFRDFAISLHDNKTNIKIHDVEIVDMVWCSTLDLFEEIPIRTNRSLQKNSYSRISSSEINLGN
ncbi:hypothetical protein DICPUDRAFT_159943 [Dictyostelium purpureum]|uniref:Uncharacterized protein n=1 Tax=Dictyostelium purpureum TaxID=5786 RepID=F1A5C1_DICPU|nr:uncharacterized protein DICPUDRAFT_159943 [Dictyostelium purpureum]EGC28608.1 hypothetical protein DICPUDRAFT_159943 [Dictyostelium purpureum]|eukprot:XP_003294866.1 hypothetical protein DICPUDRAFT_159943 [Dictyostelium purpureum]